MIKVEEIYVGNMEGALRGMRNPLESWNKSDSYYDKDGNYVVGEKDRGLALKLIGAGSDHSKFLRQIFVSMDITAPMSWWWDFDTYKVATTKNSTSRMHKLGTRELTKEDFSWDDENGNLKLTSDRIDFLKKVNQKIKMVQTSQQNGNNEEAKDLWREIYLDLPASYNFLATWTGSYENLRNIYAARSNHKQREFREFCKILETLPESDFIITKRIHEK